MLRVLQIVTAKIIFFTLLAQLVADDLQDDASKEKRQDSVIEKSVAVEKSSEQNALDTNGFAWQEEQANHIELLYRGRPVVRYMMPTLDELSVASRTTTSKPYHHVYSPDGRTLLTKASGGLFPHHCGLFYGFGAITYDDGKTCDTWHCTGKSYQKALGQSWTKGDIDGGVSHCVYIDWHGQEGEVFARERRVLGVSRGAPHGTEGWEIDFNSHLESADGKPIHLGGAPQYAGLRFCVSQEVADKTANQTYYLRTDGKGQPGSFRNWSHLKANASRNAKCENRPWNALCFVLNNRRYTVLYIDHPDNPKPAHYIELAAGCIGSSFVASVTKGKPLDVNYRLWVQEGEMTAQQCNKLQQRYVSDLQKKMREDPFR